MWNVYLQRIMETYQTNRNNRCPIALEAEVKRLNSRDGRGCGSGQSWPRAKERIGSSISRYTPGLGITPASDTRCPRVGGDEFL